MSSDLPTVENGIVTFSTGARSSADVHGLRCDLIPWEAIESLGKTFAEGVEKHGENNWTKGIPEYDLVARVFRHLLLDAWGDTSEDHLGHALCRMAMLVTLRKRKCVP